LKLERSCNLQTNTVGQFFMKLVHGLEAFHNDKTHIHITLSTVRKARWFTWAELAPRWTCDAFVPACTCKLCHHLINHSSFLLLLQNQKNHSKIRITYIIVKYQRSSKVMTATIPHYLKRLKLQNNAPQHLYSLRYSNYQKNNTPLH